MLRPIVGVIQTPVLSLRAEVKSPINGIEINQYPSGEFSDCVWALATHSYQNINPSCDLYPINDQPLERCGYLAGVKRERSAFYV